jgi:NAD(P)-dependent dehydrogenase (short-subunit alcohol dehydrogenase family)
VPGPIEGTEGLKRLADPVQKQQWINAVPLRRTGTVDDIGQAAAFLASPLAAYITGCVLVCDGGQNLPGSGFFNLGAERMLREAQRSAGD